VEASSAMVMMPVAAVLTLVASVAALVAGGLAS
jgi:hypothetical protein